jgi:hypothetical protein
MIDVPPRLARRYDVIAYASLGGSMRSHTPLNAVATEAYCRSGVFAADDN